jgi:hypothetical protein
MQNHVDEDRIEKGARIGKIATFLGLGFLGAGLVVSLVMKESPFLWASFVFLLIGVIVSSVGTMNMNKWAREPRADQALSQALKGYDNRYVLYSYLLPAPQVLLCPMGLYVLPAFGQDGEIRFDGEKLNRDFSIGRLLRFMAEEGLGKPFAEADSQIKALQQYLEENDAAEGTPIESILVFYNPKVKLEVSGAPRPVTDTKGLKKALRKLATKKLPPAKYKQLQDLFDDEWEEY